MWLKEARLIADAHLNSSTSYTDTIRALHDKFGQPQKLALKKIASILEAQEIGRGDSAAFQKFSLQIQSLVGLLKTVCPEGEIELKCGSHVARLLSKLLTEQRADFHRHQSKQPGTSHMVNQNGSVTSLGARASTTKNLQRKTALTRRLLGQAGGNGPEWLG